MSTASNSFERLPHFLRTSRCTATVGVVGALTVVLLAGTAQAATAPLSDATVKTHFDLAAGQTPENITPDRNGSVDVTFALSHQVARISASGRTTVLATLPAPADPKAAAPVLGFSIVAGLVRDGDRFYVAYATGTKAETGIWTFTEGKAPTKFADLPATGAPNAVTMNRKTGTLYVTDPVKGAVYSVPTRGSHRGDATVLASGKSLKAVSYLGVNGAKVRGQNLYVTNLDQGTILRAPLTGKKTGSFQTVASGLAGIDDFAFTGRGNQLLAAIQPASQVVLVNLKKVGRTTKARTVLTQKDGLSNPSSVAVVGRKVFVTNAAYSTQKDPNLLTALLAQD
ncbi:hypothetical protein [Kineosporia sp. NBRC 101731]|uniref:hypothetical protein n=1 Tax=Kineosporia sp. NBRC 101731 TaxID=3032199 RepID=UPI0024A052D1|nr:hypothetical protein [Kineosporia sp. NBRC 101731]GLY33949.1 hypothetical protein Kisp02_73140 [Kineosporia sp. NBRC 101731]